MAREQVEVARKEEVLRGAREGGEEPAEQARRVARVGAAVRRRRCRARRPARSRRCTPIRWRSTRGARCRALEAIPHLERAIALDPSFAMAYALPVGRVRQQRPIGGGAGVLPEGVRAARSGQRARAVLHLVALLPRCASRRGTRRSTLAHVVDGDLSARGVRLQQPRPGLGGHSAQHDEAVRAFREAIRLDPKFVPPHGNLAGSLIALEPVRRGAGGPARRRRPQGVDVHHPAADVVHARVDRRRSRGAGRASSSRCAPSTGGIWAALWEARASAFAGRVSAAHELFQRGIQTADPRRHARARRADGRGRRRDARDRRPVRRRPARGVPPRSASSRDNFTLERASRTLALCGRAEESQRLTAELAARYPAASLTTLIQRPVTAAALAVQRGQAARAIALLDPVAPYDHAPAAEFWPAYLRGQAYLQLKDAQSAARAVSEHSRSPRPGADVAALSARPSRARARPALAGERDAARARLRTVFHPVGGRRSGARESAGGPARVCAAAAASRLG